MNPVLFNEVSENVDFISNILRYLQDIQNAEFENKTSSDSWLLNFNETSVAWNLLYKHVKNLSEYVIGSLYSLFNDYYRWGILLEIIGKKIDFYYGLILKENILNHFNDFDNYEEKKSLIDSFESIEMFCCAFNIHNMNISNNDNDSSNLFDDKTDAESQTQELLENNNQDEDDFTLTDSDFDDDLDDTFDD